MRTLEGRDAPPGGRPDTCQNLAYSGRVETRRKEVGTKIKHGRRLAGFTSQEAFGAEIGKHETSVGNAERGSDRVGDGVYNAIEGRLGWPLDSIEAYIAGTGEAPWTLAAPAELSETPAEPSPADSPWMSRLLADNWTPDEIARVEGMSVDEIEAEGRVIGRFSGDDARIRYLHDAAIIKLRQSTQVSEKADNVGG